MGERCSWSRARSCWGAPTSRCSTSLRRCRNRRRKPRARRQRRSRSICAKTISGRKEVAAEPAQPSRARRPPLAAAARRVGRARAQGSAAGLRHHHRREDVARFTRGAGLLDGPRRDRGPQGNRAGAVRGPRISAPRAFFAGTAHPSRSAFHLRRGHRQGRSRRAAPAGSSRGGRTALLSGVHPSGKGVGSQTPRRGRRVKARNRYVPNPREWSPGENLPRAVSALQSARRVLLTMHRGPDGDALGSALALGTALREMGREVVVYNPDELPYNFRFLPGAAEVRREIAPDEAFDVTVATDAGARDRLGPHVPHAPRRGVLINLDHHLTPQAVGDINYVDPEAASVGILAYKIIRGLGHPLSRDAAICIYASILAATGCFRHSSTDPEGLRCAAALPEHGVDPWEMTVRVYEQQPLARMKLLAEVLATLELHHNG